MTGSKGSQGQRPQAVGLQGVWASLWLGCDGGGEGTLGWERQAKPQHPIGPGRAGGPRWERQRPQLCGGAKGARGTGWPVPLTSRVSARPQGGGCSAAFSERRP